MRKEIERLRGVIAERDDRLQAARIALNGPVHEAMREDVAR